jgi:tellurite resistance protein
MLDIADTPADNLGRGVRVCRSMSDFSASNDQSLLSFYENIREQVESDKRAGGRHRLAGASVKQYADRLRDEMDRRRLRFSPIQWD